MAEARAQNVQHSPHWPSRAIRSPEACAGSPPRWAPRGRRAPPKRGAWHKRQRQAGGQASRGEVRRRFSAGMRLKQAGQAKLDGRTSTTQPPPAPARPSAWPTWRRWSPKARLCPQRRLGQPPATRIAQQPEMRAPLGRAGDLAGHSLARRCAKLAQQKKPHQCHRRHRLPHHHRLCHRRHA